MRTGDLGPAGPGRQSGAGPFLRAPFTLALAQLAVLLGFWPAATGALELQRGAPFEPWRLLGAHLVHYSPSHLALDVAVLLCLGLVAERLAPRGTRVALAIGALAIPLAVLAFQADLVRYRGLSGLDSVLFGVLLAIELRRGLRVAWLSLAVFVAKITWELATGHAFFLDSAAEGFVPVPLAHAIGAAIGLACGLAGESAASAPASSSVPPAALSAAGSLLPRPRTGLHS